VGSLLLAALTAAWLFHPTPASAVSVPPSWMPMTMLVVSLDAEHRLQVVDQGTMPPAGGGTYPASPVMLALNTTATGMPDLAATSFADFDPAAPWSVLQGAAFSRQLGWWAGSGSAPADLEAAVEAAYGAGAGIWIESLSQSAGLETYLAVGRFGVNADNTEIVDPLAGGYAGIFGTDGSPTKWRWDYLMDHNAYAVPAASLVPGQLYTALYKVYIADAAGNELASAVWASTLETWTWQAPTVVPEPASGASLALGLLLLAAVARRRKRSARAPGFRAAGSRRHRQRA